MKIKNLTPHAVTLVNGDEKLVIPAEGTTARLSTRVEQADTIDIDGFKIPATTTVYGELTGLPDPEPGVILVVSSLVAQRVRDLYPERSDVMIPSESVRDEQGRIIGCKSLGWIPGKEINRDMETEKEPESKEEAFRKALGKLPEGVKIEIYTYQHAPIAVQAFMRTEAGHDLALRFWEPEANERTTTVHVLSHDIGPHDSAGNDMRMYAVRSPKERAEDFPAFVSEYIKAAERAGDRIIDAYLEREPADEAHDADFWLRRAEAMRNGTEMPAYELPKGVVITEAEFSEITGVEIGHSRLETQISELDADGNLIGGGSEHKAAGEEHGREAMDLDDRDAGEER